MRRPELGAMAHSSKQDPFKSYQKLAVVGQGAFGVCAVYQRPRNGPEPPKKVIIKTVAITSRSTMDNVLKEAKLLLSLRHPNIIACDGYYVRGNELLIVMHYAEGGTLQKLLNDQQGKYLDERIITNYFAQIAQAMQFMHNKNILHRDLKTQNILLNRKRTLVMLADFGISRELSTSVDVASTCVGTFYYMSPEVCQCTPYNKKSDMWALGCILYEMVELKYAFSGEMPLIFRKIVYEDFRKMENKNTSMEVCDLIQRLLNKNPEKRPDADRVVSCPWVWRNIINMKLDEGRVDNDIARLYQSGRPPADSRLNSPCSPKSFRNGSQSPMFNNLPTLTNTISRHTPSFYLQDSTSATLVAPYN